MNQARAVPAGLLGFAGLALLVGSSCSMPSLGGTDSERASAVRLEYPDGGAPLNQHFTIEVFFQGIAPVDVAIDADMPAHGHGMLTQPAVEAVGPLHYRAHGMLFHMPGDWVTTIQYKSDQGPEVVDFPVTIDFDLE